MVSSIDGRPESCSRFPQAQASGGHEHARYKRGLGRPENGVRKINSHQREALSLVTLICALNKSKYSGGGCEPLY